MYFGDVNSNKVYLVNTIGGLGNQIFCYAFYKKLCIDYPDKKFLMDISGSFNKVYDRNAEFLHLFPDAKVEIADKSLTWKLERRLKTRYRGKGHRFLILATDYINNHLLHPPEGACVSDKEFEEWGYTIPEKCWDSITFFDGFWQNTDYYRYIWKDITKNLVYRTIDDEQNLRFLKMIQNSESVSVHLRRGDYIGDPRFNILDEDYYSRIIRKVMNQKPESMFYFFSNDSDYANAKYKWVVNKRVVNINCGQDSYKDMQLMSACKTNIVANSTFSIWAAFLNRNPDRHVYYPSHYFRKERPLDYSFLSGFERVNVEFD